MKTLYGIEPDVCILNPDILINSSLDIVLPQYFFTQINYLKNGDFGDATIAANKIINSLNQREDPDLFFFKTTHEGTIYFIDEAINYLNVDKTHQNLDKTNPIDRYLLSLLYLSEILRAKIFILVSSPEIIDKCRILNFDPVTLAEFPLNGESWLQPEMLVNVQGTTSDTISETNILNASETNIQVRWRDIRVSQGTSDIEWMDVR